jgi:hypothetical protein
MSTICETALTLQQIHLEPNNPNAQYRFAKLKATAPITQAMDAFFDFQG